MRREKQRFILEVNGFDGSDVSPVVRGADGESMSACYAIILVDGQGERQSLTRVIAQWQKRKRHGQKRRNQAVNT